MSGNSDAFTGLEAAIVLIAFVVVAAVFAYVILGAGFFTTQKAQETVYKSVEQSTTNLQMVGNVYGISNNTAAGIDEIKFSISLAPGGSDIDLTRLKIVFSTPETYPIILSHNATISNTTFTARLGGIGPTVSSMTPNQQVEIDFLVYPVPKNTAVNIEIRPAVGAALPFSKTTPATITNTSVLS
ncbi:MAG: archaellin/type IV pilin N-terminal domain-containing protein [Methanoregula sp.]|jgi:flagellin FlaB